MNPHTRSILAGLAAAVLSVYVGWQIAEGQYALATLLAVLVGVAVLEWTRVLLPEAAVLGLLVAGYVLGNRGFAQTMPFATLPLLPGELGLAAAATLLVIRGSLQRRFPLQLDGLGVALLLWIAVGVGRIVFDVRQYGFLALRDFATVYYAVFFFIAREVGRGELNARRLHGLIVWCFGLLPPLALMVEAFPEFFLTQLTFRGVPLFYYKGDLLATFLCVGFFLLLPPSDRAGSAVGIFRIVWATLSLAFSLYLMSRAAMLSLAVGLVGVSIARRLLAIKVTGVLVGLALLVATISALFIETDFRQTRFYALYEHVTSILDLGGTRTYQHEAAFDTGANNQFRLVWWWSVARETFVESPVFGLGFGADLAKGFIQAYDPLMDDFHARSPHSIVITVLGRMGAVGLVTFLILLGALFRESLRLAAAVREGTAPERLLTLHASMWAIMVSAFVGVVLEGPMGAVPFWIIAGLASARSHVATATEDSASEPATLEDSESHSVAVPTRS